MISDIIDLLLCIAFVAYTIVSYREIKALRQQNTVLLHTYGLLTSMHTILSGNIKYEGSEIIKNEKAEGDKNG